MTENVIDVRSLGKRYRIGAKGPRYRTLRESISLAPLLRSNAVSRLLKGTVEARGPKPPEFWALRDVTFSVKNGEAVGIIGRNGAGKSTLLKLLSRITEPTVGAIAVRGRAASLLEVGTGFHPELTGRENVYLNGAILGMSRVDIARQFDSIVSFAEVEPFIDTQVKHYSTGMYLRLAFAVAAHLEPDILIVDEVLAVGDVSFQRKCLNKMEDVESDGRTVLFVSHNMSAVTRLCRRGILLDKGQIIADGPAHKVASEYLRSGLGTTAVREWPTLNEAPGDDVVRLERVRVTSSLGETIENCDIRLPIGIEMKYRVLKSGYRLVPNVHVFNEDSTCVFVASDTNREWRQRERPEGTFISTAWIPGNLLAEGTFTVRSAISTYAPVRVHADEEDAVAFHVSDTLDGDSARGDFAGPIPGVVRPLLRWTDTLLESMPTADRSLRESAP